MTLKNGFKLHLRIDTDYGCTDEIEEDLDYYGNDMDDILKYRDLMTPIIKKYIDSFGLPDTNSNLYFWGNDIDEKHIDSTGTPFSHYSPKKISIINIGYIKNTVEILLKN